MQDSDAGRILGAPPELDPGADPKAGVFPSGILRIVHSTCGRMSLIPSRESEFICNPVHSWRIRHDKKIATLLCTRQVLLSLVQFQ